MKVSGTLLTVFAAIVINKFSDVSSGSPGVAVSASEAAFSAEKNVSSYILPKTVFSSKVRLIFTVGIEGTGHNYFCEVFDHLFDNNPDLPRLLREDNLNAGRFNIGSSMGKNAHHYSMAIDAAKTAMRKLAQHGAELPSPGTVDFVHLKYSYPVGIGVNKALKYLDLRVLADVAEAEGVDFRVVYLRRPAKDMLVANTVHRRFQNTLGLTNYFEPEQRYMEYMKVLITDIAVVHSFLAEIDPAFVICNNFDLAGDIEQSDLIADFLAPNAYVAKLLKHSLIDVVRPHGTSADELPYEGADVVAARLQRKFDAFEISLCAGRN